VRHMEISNKTFGIFCLVVVGVTVYVRAQSIHSEPAAPQPPTITQSVASTAAPKQHRSIPNSTLPPDMTATTDTQVVSDDQAPPGDAQPTETAPGTVQPTTPKVDSSTVAVNGQQDDLTEQDDVGDFVGNETDAETPPVNNGWQLSDRDTLRLALQSMPPEQREVFRVMWFSMTPDDRADLLDQIRGTQQGG